MQALLIHKSKVTINVGWKYFFVVYIYKPFSHEQHQVIQKQILNLILFLVRSFVSKTQKLHFVLL